MAEPISSAFDYVVIMLLMLAVFGFLGLNLVGVIDRKLGEVAINIPRPDIKINIDGESFCGSKKKHEGFTSKQNKQLSGAENNGKTYRDKEKSDLMTKDAKQLIEKFAGKDERPPAKKNKVADPVAVDKKNMEKEEKSKVVPDGPPGPIKDAPAPYDRPSSSRLEKPTIKDLSQKTPYVWQVNAGSKEDTDDETDYNYVGTVIGCKPRGERLLHPDQIACDQLNYKTAENYYRYYFKYPFIPDAEQSPYLPSNYSQFADMMEPNRTYRVIQQKNERYANKNPFPSNTYFAYVQA